jgi:hypothetical protein
LRWLELSLSTARKMTTDELDPALQKRILEDAVTYLGDTLCRTCKAQWREGTTVVEGSDWELDCAKLVASFEGAAGWFEAAVEAARAGERAGEAAQRVRRLFSSMVKHEYLVLTCDEPSAELVSKTLKVLERRSLTIEDEARLLHAHLMSSSEVVELFVDEAGIDRALRQWWHDPAL